MSHVYKTEKGLIPNVSYSQCIESQIILIQLVISRETCNKFYHQIKLREFHWFVWVKNILYLKGKLFSPFGSLWESKEMSFTEPLQCIPLSTRIFFKNNEQESSPFLLALTTYCGCKC